MVKIDIPSWLHLRRKPVYEPAPADLLWSKGVAGFADVNGGADYVHAHTESVHGKRFFRRRFADAKGLVWVRLSTRARAGQPCDLDHFVQAALPHIHAPFVLLTTDGDVSVPGELAPATVAALLASPWLMAWATQDHDGAGGPKLRPFPIGLDLHTPRPEGGPGALANLLRQIAATRVPLAEAPLRIFTDVALNRNSAERHRAHAQLWDCAHVDFLPERVSQRSVWQAYARYPFVLSATGNALDCHRTWEALYLGAIVIAMHSALDPLYDGLPVVLVHDWDELRDATNLARWREHFAPLADPSNLARRLHPQTWLAPLRAALSGG